MIFSNEDRFNAFQSCDTRHVHLSSDVDAIIISASHAWVSFAFCRSDEFSFGCISMKLIIRFWWHFAEGWNVNIIITRPALRMRIRILSAIKLIVRRRKLIANRSFVFPCSALSFLVESTWPQRLLILIIKSERGRRGGRGGTWNLSWLWVNFPRLQFVSQGYVLLIDYYY